MKVRFFITICFTISICFNSIGQTNNVCDTVYDKINKKPKYSIGESKLDKYLLDTLHQTLFNYSIKRLYIVFTIDKQGFVVDTTFPNQDYLSEKCKTEIKNRLVYMKDWNPGKKKGKKVCSRFYWTIIIAKT